MGLACTYVFAYRLVREIKIIILDLRVKEQVMSCYYVVKPYNLHEGRSDTINILRRPVLRRVRNNFSTCVANQQIETI